MDIDLILKQLADSAQQVNVRQLYTLSGLTKKNLEIFKRWWPTVDPPRRLSLLRQLLTITENSFEVNFDTIFLLAMGDKDGEIRTLGIEGLWESEDCKLVAPFLYLLVEDKVEQARAAAAAALGRFILMGELEQIDSALRNRIETALLGVINNVEEAAEVKRRAVEAIAYSCRPGIRKIISDAYESDDERMQASALFAMGRSADSHWQETLITELDNPSPEIRYEAARACGELELVIAVPELGQLAMDDSEREVQEAAVWALGNIGGKETHRILETCYESEDEVLSQFAADALEQIDWVGESRIAPIFDFDQLDENWDIDE